MQHKPVRQGDQYYCPVCQRTWDYGDEEPPRCEPVKPFIGVDVARPGSDKSVEAVGYVTATGIHIQEVRELPPRREHACRKLSEITSEHWKRLRECITGKRPMCVGYIMEGIEMRYTIERNNRSNMWDVYDNRMGQIERTGSVEVGTKPMATVVGYEKAQLIADALNEKHDREKNR